MKKIILLIIFFYILTLFQASFLIHFSIWGLIPNFILISIVLLNLFEKTENYSGFLGAAGGGFFLDVFSSRPIGFSILIFVLIAVFIKFVLKKHFSFRL